MAYYQASTRPDRLKALAAVLLVHAGLAAIILSGLNVRIAGVDVNPLKTFDISDPPPPPPIVEQPRPKRDESSAPKDEAAPANIRSKPTPVVAPEPRIPLPVDQPIRTAEVKGPEGLDRSAGASNVAGPGTGAGGTGSGFGGGGSGGTGSGQGYTPASRISKIPDSQYRRIVAASGMRRGRIGITLKVNTDGRPSHCRIARTSGNPSVDSMMCQMALQYVRFRAARDPQGRPVAQDITWYPDWSPN